MQPVNYSCTARYARLACSDVVKRHLGLSRLFLTVTLSLPAAANLSLLLLLLFFVFGVIGTSQPTPLPLPLNPSPHFAIKTYDLTVFTKHFLRHLKGVVWTATGMRWCGNAPMGGPVTELDNVR